MGLNEGVYMITNIIFFFLKFSLFFYAVAIYLVIICKTTEESDKSDLKAWFFERLALIPLYSLNLSIINVFLCFNIKKVQTIQNVAPLFNSLIIYLFIIFQNFSGNSIVGYLIPYLSYQKYLFLWMLRMGNYNFRSTLLQMISTAVVWFFITLYLDAIYPRDDEQQKSPFFLCKPKRQVVVRGDLEENLMEQEDGLVLQHLDKNFKHFKALSDVTMTVKKGELVALLGHNGAGKSTLINIITGIYSQTKGRIFYDRRDFREIQETNSFKIGICPSFDVYFNDMTVYQHLRMMSFLRGTENVDQKINDVLKVLDMGQYANMKASQLSGGYKRRLNLAISLFDDPQCMFLDEPTSSIDPLSRQHIWHLLYEIKKTRQNTITFLTTHHLEEAEFLADTIKVLVQGKIYAQGTIQELKNKFGVGYNISLFFPEKKVENMATFQIVEEQLTQSFNNLQFENDQKKL